MKMSKQGEGLKKGGTNVIIKREIITRDDVVHLFLDWIRPLKNHYSRGAARLMIGDTSAHYSEGSAYMEGYSRVLWGLGSLFSQKNQTLPAAVLAEIAEWKELVLRGLVNGTDPGHEEYWKDVGDYDQKMVEMAAIVNALLLSQETLWEPLAAVWKQNIYQWLNQINTHEVYANNWRFFRILVNMFFIKTGFAYDEKRMEEDWAVIEGCYEGEGWYFDGHSGQKDYYIPFAMHYYGLLYAAYMKDIEPERCSVLRHRAENFLRDFLYWFDRDGREVPFGRSLTYRFAHSAFFSAMAFSGAEADMSVLKHMVLGNLRYWSGQPMFDNGGIMTIGYQYPNLIMSERYNAPGSPYWSFKTFLALALPEEHAFWQCGECGPSFETIRFLEKPNMIAVHENQGHTLLYPAGQHSGNFGNTVAKYQKFVYSNLFGFSIPRGVELEDGAFDNTLAVTAAGENEWHMRNGDTCFEVTRRYIRMQYEPVKGVKVKTVIVPLRVGHMRIHLIQSDIDAEYADGGFAIRTEQQGQEMRRDMVCITGNEVKCVFPWGNAGAVCISGMGEPRLVSPFPNTNIMYGSTVIPTMYYHLCAGTHCIADYFYGDGCFLGNGKSVTLPQFINRNDKDKITIEILHEEEKIMIEF